MDNFSNDSLYPQENEIKDGTNNSKSNSVISMICGIISILFCCCSILAFIPAIFGIVFFAKSRKRGERSGMAVAGLVCSILGILGALFTTIIYGIYGYFIYYIINDLANNNMLETFMQMDQETMQQFLMEHYFQMMQ